VSLRCGRDQGPDEGRGRRERGIGAEAYAYEMERLRAAQLVGACSVR
jgi:hypothetical protein